MTKTGLLCATAVLAIGLAPAAASAQSRQDQQMLQEMRIMQEQVNQLKVMVATLADQIKATNTRLDGQETIVRTNHADDSNTLHAVQTLVNTLGEKMNLYAQQVDRFGTEIPSLRTALEQQQKSIDKIIDLLGVPSPTAPGNVSTGTPATQGAALPASPVAAFTQAKGLYAQGYFDLAVKAFESFIQDFPNATAYLPEANYWIGMSQFNVGKYAAALTAFETVTETYKTWDKVSDAYFGLAECYRALNKRTEAIAAYDKVIALYPDTSAALQAKSRKGSIKS